MSFWSQYTVNVEIMLNRNCIIQEGRKVGMGMNIDLQHCFTSCGGRSIIFARASPPTPTPTNTARNTINILCAVSECQSVTSGDEYVT